MIFGFVIERKWNCLTGRFQRALISFSLRCCFRVTCCMILFPNIKQIERFWMFRVCISLCKQLVCNQICIPILEYIFICPAKCCTCASFVFAWRYKSVCLKNYNWVTIGIKSRRSEKIADRKPKINPSWKRKWARKCENYERKSTAENNKYTNTNISPLLSKKNARFSSEICLPFEFWAFHIIYCILLRRKYVSLTFCPSTLCKQFPHTLFKTTLYNNFFSS